ncbi:MAG TPA: DNA methyltransferase [Caulobacteraceae bacterium]|jgi:site-specific DNA-methyltransferase (adenine-specific)
MNALYYGDNLAVLRDCIGSESVDLVYLDPPFNSQATYNLLFRSPAGGGSQAQIEAFEDTWHWGHEAEGAFDQVMRSGNTNAADMLRAVRSFLGDNDMMAYLAMMAVRLIELHRVLKPTGSLYLHCDPTASHYLKILLDAVFGPSNFRSEIIWKRSHGHNSANRYGSSHDTILFYARSASSTWNKNFHNYDAAYVERHYRHTDSQGQKYKHENPTGAGIRKGETGQPWRGIDPTAKNRHWARPPSELERMDAAGLIHWPGKAGAWPYIKVPLGEMKGVPVQDLWTDIDVLNMMAKERLGYPTQKPVALLERIISASSNPGGVVLDPFCGCGTAVHAAQKLGRQWIGIDVTHLAISLIERRLKDAFPDVVFEVHGTPKDLWGARDLAFRDKYQFQWWAVSLIDAQPFAGKKKGADGGVDGLIYFRSDARTTERAIVSVKGGDSVGVPMIRDLKGVLERERAPIGVFLTLPPSTRPMETEAASAGFYELGGRRYPRLQIITIEQALAGTKPAIPHVDMGAAFRRASREEADTQPDLI